MVVADSGKTFNVNIEAQSLDAAIVVFSATTRSQVSADSSIIAGKRSAPVSGTFTPREILERLIEGTGLSVSEIDNATFALSSGAPGASPQTIVPDIIEEIIVTGNKQNRSLQDTQISAEVFTGERIERELLISADDLFERAPNIASTGVTNGVSIRGVSRIGVGTAGSGVTSNVYLDGAPASNNALLNLLTLWDVDQVEVLRGPQSTVQGRNALAGAVIINSKDPSDEFELDGQVRIGEHGSRQYSASVSIPVIENELAIRLAADQINYDGDVKNVFTNEDSNFQDATSLRGKILFEPSALPALRFDLQIDYVEGERGRFEIVVPPVPASDPGFGAFDPFDGETFDTPDLSEYETLRPILRIDAELSEVFTLTAIGTYEDTIEDREFGDVLDPLRFSFSGTQDEESKISSVEVRLNFRSGPWSGWLGGYYYEEENEFGFDGLFQLSALGIPTLPTESVIGSSNIFRNETENSALFGEARYELNDRWAFELGFRYDREAVRDGGVVDAPATSDPANCVIDPIVPGIGGVPCIIIAGSLFGSAADPLPEEKFEAFLPRGTVIYSFDEWRSVSLAVQRGYRAGGVFSQNTILNGVPATITDNYDPEFLTNYEFALRSQWFDQRLTANLNVFYSKWTDQQISIPGPSGLPGDVAIINTGSSDLFGGELSIDYLATESLRLFMTVGYLDTEFTDFPFAINSNGLPVNPTDPQFANLDGNEFSIAPELTLSAGIYYEHASGWFGDATVSYTGEAFSDVENLSFDRTDSFTLVNLRVGFRKTSGEIYLYAENLFDSRAVTQRNLGSVSTLTGTFSQNDDFLRINRPRIVGGGIKFSL